MFLVVIFPQISLLWCHADELQNLPASVLHSRAALPANVQWAEAIETLSKQLETPIVAFKPSREIDTKQLPNDGDAKILLSAIAQASQAQWIWWNDSLLLSKNLVPYSLKLIPEAPLNPKKPEGMEWAQLLTSFTKAQLDAFQKGESIALADLTQEQQSLYFKVFDGFRNGDPKKPNAKIIIFINSSAFVYLRGYSTYNILADPQVLAIPALTNSYVPIDDLIAPRVKPLEGQEYKFLEDNSVTLKTTSALTLLQLCELINAELQPENKVMLQASRQVAESKVIVSRGIWQAKKLLKLVLEATQTKVRRVGNLAVLTPSTESLFAQDMASEGELRFREAFDSEAAWNSALPVLRKLYQSPLSGSNKLIPEDYLFDPQLIAYEKLSLEQQKWLIHTELEWESEKAMFTPEELKNKDITVSFTPLIVTTLTDQEVRVTTGTSIPDSYFWALLRTMDKRKNEKPVT